MIYFTSDTHFGHDNIRIHCNRPFSSTPEMDEAMIANWNSVVGPTDTVYFLGDFAWKNHLAYKARLNGTIHWILGNHDKCSHEVKASFASVADLFMGKINGIEFTLCHYPFVTWPKKAYGSVHLYGHVHGRYSKDNEASLDVGVDVHNFTPVSLDKIIEITKSKSAKNTNAHTHPNSSPHVIRRASEIQISGAAPCGDAGWTELLRSDKFEGEGDPQPTPSNLRCDHGPAQG